MQQRKQRNVQGKRQSKSGGGFKSPTLTPFTLDGTTRKAISSSVTVNVLMIAGGGSRPAATGANGHWGGSGAGELVCFTNVDIPSIDVTSKKFIAYVGAGGTSGSIGGVDSRFAQIEGNTGESALPGVYKAKGGGGGGLWATSGGGRTTAPSGGSGGGAGATFNQPNDPSNTPGTSTKYNASGFGSNGGSDSGNYSGGGGGATGGGGAPGGGAGYPATGGSSSSINTFLQALNSANNTNTTIKGKVSNGICGGGAGVANGNNGNGGSSNGGGYVVNTNPARIAPSSYGSGDSGLYINTNGYTDLGYGGHEGVIVVSYDVPTTDILSGGQNTFDYLGRRYRCFTTTNDTTNVLTQTNDNSSLRIPLTSGVKTGDYCLGPGLPTTCKVNNVASDGTYTYVLLSSPIGGISTATNAYAFISL